MTGKEFRIFAFMTVKNESDIIIETLIGALKWADKIFVMDNMSDDDTWEKLERFAQENDKVVLWGRYGGKFHLSLRQVIFNDYRHLAKDGDWWCRLDGDEFYIDDPREFLNDLGSDTDCVYNASFQYYYTEDDFEREKENVGALGIVTDRLMHYKCNHSEIRFIKERGDLCWPQYAEWPINLLNPTEKRIRLKHYQYRTLQQISERLRARNSSASGSSFSHEKVSAEEWYKRRGFKTPESEEYQRYRIVMKSDLDSEKNYIYSDDKLPKINKPSFKSKMKRNIVSSIVNYVNKK